MISAREISTALARTAEDAHNADPRQCGDGCPFHDEDVHAFFGLSYANFLVLERTLLQAMPGDWQRKLIALLDELAEVREDGLGIAPDDPAGYNVTARGSGGEFARNPLPHYRRAHRDLEALRDQVKP